MRAGRYFVHGHPRSASSWKVDSIKQLVDSPMVVKAYANMCAFGIITSEDKERVAPVLKPTVFLANSTAVQIELSKKCPGCARHVHLVEGNARAAQVYPLALCRAVCRGIVDQALLDYQALRRVKCVGGKSKMDSLTEICAVEHEENDWQRYWDDLSGQALNWELPQAARRE